MDVAALLALFGALISRVGDVIRKRSAQGISDRRSHVELFRMSMRDMKWWLGGGAAVVGAALRAVAPALGSAVLVQALQVTALGETLGADGPELIALAVAAVVVIVATAALAPSEAARMAADDSRRVTAGRIPAPAPDRRSPVAAGATSQA